MGINDVFVRNYFICYVFLGIDTTIVLVSNSFNNYFKRFQRVISPTSLVPSAALHFFHVESDTQLD